jgi:hypothetical protein
MTSSQSYCQLPAQKRNLFKIKLSLQTLKVKRNQGLLSKTIALIVPAAAVPPLTLVVMPAVTAVILPCRLIDDGYQ